MADIPEAPLTIAAARLLYERSGSGHDFDHVLRVLALAERIGRAEGADLAVVRTAALLHDVGEQQDRRNHHLRGAAIAREILAGSPPEFIESVAHAIEAHRFRAEPAPRTLEAKVVSDADKLDAIGAIGIARVFAHAGARGTALWRVPWRQIEGTVTDSGDTLPPDRNLEEASEAGSLDANAGPAILGPAYTPSHEFVYKLNRLPSLLYTATARAIAADRQEFMRAFFDRIDQEMLELAAAWE